MTSEENISRFKCAEIYTLVANAEIYVECFLCTDHPICSLEEYTNHLEIWHYNWSHFTSEFIQNNEIYTNIEERTEKVCHNQCTLFKTCFILCL